MAQARARALAPVLLIACTREGPPAVGLDSSLAGPRFLLCCPPGTGRLCDQPRILSVTSRGHCHIEPHSYRQVLHLRNRAHRRSPALHRGGRGVRSQPGVARSRRPRRRPAFRLRRKRPWPERRLRPSARTTSSTGVSGAAKSGGLGPRSTPSSTRASAGASAGPLPDASTRATWGCSIQRRCAR